MAPRRKVTIKVPASGIPTAPELVTPSGPLTTDALLALAPITVTGADFDVDLLASGQLRRAPIEALFVNESQYQMVVTTNGHQYVVRSYDAYVVPCNGAAKAHVHPFALATPIPSAPTNTLQVVLAPLGTSIPGVFPSPTARLTAGFYQPSILDRIDTAAGSGNKSYTIPAGAITIVVTIDLDNAGRSVTPTQIIAKCFPSDFTPIQAGATVINHNARLMGLINPNDTAFDVEWTMAAPNAANCFLDVAVYGVNLLDPQNIAFQFDSNLNLNVSMASASPAPWQAPGVMTGGTFTAAAGSDHTLVTGVAGLQVWVFDLMINHNGNIAYEGSLWDGPSATGIERAKIRMPAADTEPVHVVGSGARAVATAGNSLIWRPDAEQVGTTTYFTLAYSQG